MLKEVITFHTTNPQILLTKSKQNTPFFRKPWLGHRLLNNILFLKVWFLLCLICVPCRHCCTQPNICRTLMVLSSVGSKTMPDCHQTIFDYWTYQSKMIDLGITMWHVFFGQNGVWFFSSKMWIVSARKQPTINNIEKIIRFSLLNIMSSQGWRLQKVLFNNIVQQFWN